MNLSESIVTYLNQNNIPFAPGDFSTGQPEGQADQILFWNQQKLGPQPTQAQLNAAYVVWEGQQIQAQNKSQASALLSATDWTSIPDVANPSASTPFLLNQGEFLAWRSQIRAIAINPPTTPVTFPDKPTEKWSS